MSVKKCRSALWDKRGIDSGTREARIKVGRSHKPRASKDGRSKSGCMPADLPLDFLGGGFVGYVTSYVNDRWKVGGAEAYRVRWICGRRNPAIRGDPSASDRIAAADEHHSVRRRVQANVPMPRSFPGSLIGSPATIYQQAFLSSESRHDRVAVVLPCRFLIVVTHHRQVVLDKHS